VAESEKTSSISAWACWSAVAVSRPEAACSAGVSSAWVGGALRGEVDFALGSAEDADCFEVGDVCFEEMVPTEIAGSFGEAGLYILAIKRGSKLAEPEIVNGERAGQQLRACRLGLEIL
jgi:hypothetical protein